MCLWATFLHSLMYSSKLSRIRAQLAPANNPATVINFTIGLARWNSRITKGSSDITDEPAELWSIFTLSSFSIPYSWAYLGSRLNCCKTFNIIFSSQMDRRLGSFRHWSLRESARALRELYLDSQKPGRYLRWIDSMIFIKHYNTSPSYSITQSHYSLPIPYPSLSDSLILIDKVVIMSSSKPRINIERALRELTLEVSQRYQPVEQPLTEISANLPSSKEFSRRDSKDSKDASIAHRVARKNSNKENPTECMLVKPKHEEPSLRRNSTYVAISKTLQHKTHLIGQQKHEIEVLRQCVEEVKHGQVKDNQEKAKSAQLAALEAKEKECLEGLSQILGLKDSLCDIKRKYNTLQQEKTALITQRNSLLAQRNLLANRFNSIFTENEELTLAITHLKQEKQDIQTANQSLQAQLPSLKQQLRLKNASDERMLGLERRLSQSMEKVGETQEQVNQWQMKYYRLQQQADVARHDGEQRLASALRQCRAEREEHEQEVSRLTASLRQAEQRAAQQERIIKQLQEKPRNQNDAERAIQVERKWQNYTQELTKQFQLQKQQQIYSIKAEKHSLQQQICSLQRKLQTALAERQVSEVKSLELMSEREHMLRHFSSLITQKQQEAKRSRALLVRSEEELSKVRDSAQAKVRQERQILTKIEELQRRLTEENERLTQINASLQEQLDQTTSILTIVTSERDSLTISKQQTEKETRYYRQKYEQQLLEYNSLSQYSHGLQVQQASLLSSHTAQLIEASNLKAELALLSSDLNKLAQGPSQSDLALLQQEIKQLRKELDSEQAEVTSVRREAARWKLQATSLQNQIGRLQLQLRREGQSVREWQGRTQDRQAALREVRGQLSEQVQQIHHLTLSIASIQDKYSSLHCQYQQQLSQWGRQSEVVRMQHSHLKNSRLSAQYQLDNSQTALAILQQQNAQLQRIFSLQLDRRNTIIRQLMAEKRSLFGQLVGRED